MKKALERLVPSVSLHVDSLGGNNYNYSEILMRKFIIKKSKNYIYIYIIFKNINSWIYCSLVCLFPDFSFDPPFSFIQEDYEIQDLMIQFLIHNLPCDFVHIFSLLCECGCQLHPPKSDSRRLLEY